VPVREKIKSAAPGGTPGAALFSALRNTWKDISAWSPEKPGVSRACHAPDFGNRNWPTELHNLIEALAVVRRRALANALLRSCTRLWTWILAGLIVAAAVSPKLAWAVISAGALVAIGAIAVFVWTWRARPSAYSAACDLEAQLATSIRLPVFTTGFRRRSTWRPLRIPME
jgi:hypothetical protein